MTDSIGDQPARPYRYSDGHDYTGLTTREYAAIHIAAGMAANPGNHSGSFQDRAMWAVQYTDTLMAELEKPRD